MVVGALQSFQFFKTNNLSKFRYWVLYYLINVIKLYKNQSVKANFILTTPATLNNIKHANVNHSFNQLLMCYVFEKKINRRFI